MESYLESVRKQFLYYKSLGEKAMSQLGEQELFWQFNPDSNSIAIIVNHLAGNMRSRFTDFMTTDGEKPWRNRDAEFEDSLNTAAQVQEVWESGWLCLLNALDGLAEHDLEKIIYIRNDGHTVTEAINRQLAHYPYHIGQMIYIAKMLRGEKWNSLSIPKNQSATYNSRKFSQEKDKRHFTDDL